jgi:hypothetical protein
MVTLSAVEPVEAIVGCSAAPARPVCVCGRAGRPDVFFSESLISTMLSF